MAALEDDLLVLGGLREQHLRVIRARLEGAGGEFSAPDVFMWAALNRSIAVIDGLKLMVESSNFLCAAVLVRLQLDNLCRLHALDLVDDVHEFLLRVLRGERIQSMKDRSGKPMTDKYLIEKIAAFDARFKAVYDTTSGYVHLSMAHIRDAMEFGEDRRFTMNLSGGVSFDRDAREYRELVGAFVWITGSMLNLVESWSGTVEQQGESPAESH